MSAMYLTNKYTRYYYSIVQRAQSRVTQYYTEKHHIIPKSLGGSNNEQNIVCLTPREHFICHRLLCKMLVGKQKRSMAFALWQMTRFNKKQKRYGPPSRVYDYIKKLISVTQTGVPLSEEHKQAMRGPRAPMSEEQKRIRSLANKGKTKSAETRKKMSEAKKKMWIERKKGL